MNLRGIAAMTAVVIFLSAGSVGATQIGLVASNNGDTGTTSGLGVARSALLATGLFDASEITIVSGSNTSPSLVDLTPYDALLVWTNYSPDTAESWGNVLADYVDAGGGLVLAAASFSSGTAPQDWDIAGTIMTSGYSPFTPADESTTDPSETMDWPALVPGHAVFDGISAAPRFWVNSSYSDPILDSGATTLAVDNSANSIKLVAINSAGNIIGLNMYPGGMDNSPWNAEARRLVANALIVVPEPISMVILLLGAGLWFFLPRYRRS